MPVFKMYFKILRSYVKQCAVYISIFLFIFFIFTSIYRNGEQNNAFTATKVNYVLEDKDQSELSSSLANYLANQHTQVDMEHDEEAIKDALFFENIQIFLQIPEHFEEDLQAGRTPQINMEQKPDYAFGTLFQQQINGYVNGLHTYIHVQPSASMQEIVQYVEADISKQVDIQMIHNQDVTNEEFALSMYFSYAAYILMALFFIFGSMILTSIYDQAIRMRNLISPIHHLSFNLQLFSANILSSFGFWGIIMIALQCMLPNAIFTKKGFYFVINSVIFVVVCISITYLIANLLAGKDNAQDKTSGIGNVLCLGMSFLGGVFVPQAFLKEGVKLLGSFLPTFWYMKAVNKILAIQEFHGDAFLEILQCFGIQILFAVAFFVAAVFVARMKTSARTLNTNDLGTTHG